MKLVFVYNAESGVFNTLTDIAHKLFSPETYQCNLCNLTHGYFKAHDQWVSFLNDLDAEIEFLHRDEYLKKYTSQESNDIAFPAIFVKNNEELKLWIDRSVINEMSSSDELMEMIRAAVLKKASGYEEEDAFLRLPI